MCSFILFSCLVNKNSGELKQVQNDEALHKDESMEWWYFSGILRSIDSQKEYGMEYVIFHSVDKVSAEHTLQGHVAISDPGSNKYINDYFASTVADSVALLRDKLPLKLSINNNYNSWKIKGENGRFHLKVEMTAHPGYGFDLTTEGITKAYSHGFSGTDDLFGAGYFSYPALKTKGVLNLKNEKKKVEGTIWYDRVWNADRLLKKEMHWNWFSLRIKNVGQLMILEMNNTRDNSTKIFGTFFPLNEQASDLKKESIDITEKTFWKSPVSKITYPIGWDVNIPSLNMMLHLEASIKEQEFRAHMLNYWEGLCQLQGIYKGKAVSGNAYVEIKN